MQLIQIADVYSQTFTTQLGGQNCQINLYQKSTGLFCDVYVSGVLIIGGVLCLNNVRIVRDLYLGFVGDLCFNDSQGVNAPSSPGLGSRYQFFSLQTSDLNGLG